MDRRGLGRHRGCWYWMYLAGLHRGASQSHKAEPRSVGLSTKMKFRTAPPVARQRTKAKRSLAGQRGRRDQKRFPLRGFLHKNSLPRWQTWRGAESDRAAGRDGWVRV